MSERRESAEVDAAREILSQAAFNQGELDGLL
jgi:hypothetical protein